MRTEGTPTNNSDHLVTARWPAPENVRAISTTRNGGASQGAWSSLNLATNSKDSPEHLAANRVKLGELLQLDCEPRWLQQVHGAQIISDATAATDRVADGQVSATPGTVCAILSADCVPILLCDRHGTEVAALHAGWRGLVAGVVNRGVAAMKSHPRDLLAWLGPCIRGPAYEVGIEVKSAFDLAFGHVPGLFAGTRDQHWSADLPTLAIHLLHQLGIRDTYDCGHCTYTESDLFFSYRRDGETGRQASCIWLMSGK